GYRGLFLTILRIVCQYTLLRCRLLGIESIHNLLLRCWIQERIRNRKDGIVNQANDLACPLPRSIVLYKDRGCDDPSFHNRMENCIQCGGMRLGCRCWHHFEKAPCTSLTAPAMALEAGRPWLK